MKNKYPIADRWKLNLNKNRYAPLDPKYLKMSPTELRRLAKVLLKRAEILENTPK